MIPTLKRLIVLYTSVTTSFLYNTATIIIVLWSIKSFVVQKRIDEYRHFNLVHLSFFLVYQLYIILF